MRSEGSSLFCTKCVLVGCVLVCGVMTRSCRSVSVEVELLDPYWEQQLEAAEKVLSEMDTKDPGCWRTAVNLFGERSCSDLSDEGSLGLLALAFTECHLKSSGRRPLSAECTRTRTVESCTAAMNAEEFGAYTTFFTQTPALCYYIRGAAFRDDARDSVNKLLAAAAQAAKQLRTQSAMHEELREAARAVLDKHGEINHRMAELANAAAAAYSRSEYQQQQLISAHHESLKRVEQLQRDIQAATNSTGVLRHTAKLAALTLIVLAAAFAIPQRALLVVSAAAITAAYAANSLLNTCGTVFSPEGDAASSLTNDTFPAASELWRGVLCGPLLLMLQRSETVSPALTEAVSFWRELLVFFLLIATLRSWISFMNRGSPSAFRNHYSSWNEVNNNNNRDSHEHLLNRQLESMGQRVEHLYALVHQIYRAVLALVAQTTSPMQADGILNRSAFDVARLNAPGATDAPAHDNRAEICSRGEFRTDSVRIQPPRAAKSCSSTHQRVQQRPRRSARF
mmetsp:Transcript_3979/g.8736  ORF Transcript_3979/g.8736 Transcript_3979/m.8736 type:complete len:510 (-) Transcript_3979:684-2213(-)